MKKIRTLAALLAVSALFLAGCTETGSHGSRHTLYEDVAGISSDSTLVAVVEIGDQNTVQEDIGMTLSNAKVTETYAPEGLGTALTEDAQAMGAKWDPGQTEITVHQLGTAEMSEVVAPILKVGKQYLLFLTPTMVQGSTPTDFYVTGGSAGIYEVQDGEKAFVHGAFDEGDTLPQSLTPADLGH